MAFIERLRLRRASKGKGVKREPPQTKTMPQASKISDTAPQPPENETSEKMKQGLREAWKSRIKAKKPTNQVISRNVYPAGDPALQRSLEDLAANPHLQRFSNDGTSQLNQAEFENLSKGQQKKGVWIRYQAQPAYLRPHLDEASQTQFDEKIPQGTVPTEAGIDIYHRIKRIKGGQVQTKRVLALTLPGNGYLQWKRGEPSPKPEQAVTKMQTSKSPQQGVLGESIDPEPSSSRNA